MKIVQSLLTQNPCYKAGKKITVKGLMLHSVGKCNDTHIGVEMCEPSNIKYIKGSTMDTFRKAVKRPWKADFDKVII